MAQYGDLSAAVRWKDLRNLGEGEPGGTRDLSTALTGVSFGRDDSSLVGPGLRRGLFRPHANSPLGAGAYEEDGAGGGYCGGFAVALGLVELGGAGGDGGGGELLGDGVAG